MYKKLIIEQEEEFDWAQAERDVEAERQKATNEPVRDNDRVRDNDNDHQNHDNDNDQKKPKPKIELNQKLIIARTEMIEHVMNFIENVYIIGSDKGMTPQRLLKYLTTDFSYNSNQRATFLALILNSFAHSSNIDKKYLNYVITANGQPRLPNYTFYVKDVLHQMQLGGIRNNYPFRNFRNLIIHTVRSGINHPDADIKESAKSIINFISSKNIGSIRIVENPDTNRFDIMFTPSYKLYADPNSQLKKLYDMKFFGEPIK